MPTRQPAGWPGYGCIRRCRRVLLVGNQIKTTDARGKDWLGSHDALDRPVTATNPELQAENTVYRSDNAVTQFRNGRNLATNKNSGDTTRITGTLYLELRGH